MPRKKYLTLADLSSAQRRLFRAMLVGRGRLYWEDEQESLHECYRLADDQIEAELSWYRMSPPETRDSSSAGQAMEKAAGFGGN